MTTPPQLAPEAIAALIDHTILRADATRADVVRACAEALDLGFATVCVNSYWIPVVATELAGSTVSPCAAVGFPLGAMSTEGKLAETRAALRDGAREIDMVLNIGALRDGDFATVRSDIDALVNICHRENALLKVILETALLSDDQKRSACRLAKTAQADFVKTSTGFGPAGATVADVRLMREAAGGGVRVKASGGIRSLTDLLAMVDAGADRIGTSSGVAIMTAARGGGAHA
jgi:deoxyribose-phosphate aldolase